MQPGMVRSGPLSCEGVEAAVTTFRIFSLRIILRFSGLGTATCVGILSPNSKSRFYPEIGTRRPKRNGLDDVHMVRLARRCRWLLRVSGQPRVGTCSVSRARTGRGRRNSPWWSKRALSQGPCLDCARDIRPTVNMRVMKQNRMSNDGNDLFGCEGSVIR